MQCLLEWKKNGTHTEGGVFISANLSREQAGIMY